MMTISPTKAAEYFENKLEFTTGPFELQEMLKNNEVTVIDVRSPEDFRKGHIPGSINLTKDKWSSFAGLSENKTNVLYCYSIVCHLSARGCKYFAENGYPVMELEGGFDEWQKYGLPVER
jgi:rhodanese-related sulfurtransferase